jgi:hypothetical protein
VGAKVFRVAGDERIHSGRDCYLEEGEVVRVGQSDGKRNADDMFGVARQRQEVSNVMIIEG